MKTAENKKIKEAAMLAKFRPGEALLQPLVLKKCVLPSKAGDRADARLEASLRGEKEIFRFAVESKARDTPQVVQLAIHQARAAAKTGEQPMIQVPYLSNERLRELEKAGVSGVDLCGNGIIIVPGRLFILCSGAPNQHRDSRPLSNPYRGLSAMVARMLLTKPVWNSLSSLASAIQEVGVSISLAQVSKAVQAMSEDLIVTKKAGQITLTEPLRLLDHLARGWRGIPVARRVSLRLPEGKDWAASLSSSPRLRWALTGESSVSRHVSFGQRGAKKIAVSDLENAMTLLGGKEEPVPSFADVELIETDEPGCYFSVETDAKRIRWAGKLQTWLELQAGDARQQDAAHDLRETIIKEAHQ